MGPLLLPDKSFIQMLTAEETDELGLWFDIVIAPTLVHEIIADLRRRPSRGMRFPEGVVRTLAARLARSHGCTPANFRKLAIGNMAGAAVPMTGQVPLDPDAANVHVSPDRKYLAYDSTKEQIVWMQWARGDFTDDDAAVAMAWRHALDNVNLKAIGTNWRQFVEEHIGSTHDISRVIERVDRLLQSQHRETQIRLSAILFAFLRARPEAGIRYSVRYVTTPGATITSLAPYAASVLRLYIAFMAALALGITTLRPSNVIDLQYLFYAPFSMAFVSNDRLHAQLFPAAGSRAIFVSGEEMKADLTRRMAWRKGLGSSGWAAHRETHDFYPPVVEGSPVDEDLGEMDEASRRNSRSQKTECSG